ncbi:unnamed protein product [Adineta steineri]|uniref:B box-type domain-containing protein n=1 Tax=Adineta steineri TaxID=433720 RepID=A0A814CJ12_9BILA|nr:unnamed protein product [Adineta steineri]
MMSKQKQCVTCNKSIGILTCNGCEQRFCGKHVIEHRQNLANQLDDIMQDHDLLQQELKRSSDEHTLIEKINQWEIRTIMKIQTAAKNARTELQQKIEVSKKQISKACHDIAANLRSSREADDFSENDLIRWIQQLDKLKLETISQSSIQLIEDEQSVIHLIKIHENKSICKAIVPYRNEFVIQNPTDLSSQEKFSKVIGPGKIIDDGLLAKCTGTDLDYAFILGQQVYSQDKQTIRFKIGQCKSPYNIFFGCISFQMIENENKIHYYSPLTAGWFGCNEIYQHGAVNYNYKIHGYKSDEIASNDIVQLTFDCSQRQIELFHERTNKRHTLSVNIDEAPLPWKLLLVLNRHNDYVRILPQKN